MKKLHTLPDEVVKLLTERLSDEYTAFHTYQAMSNWCQNVGFFKAAKFYAEESTGELSHAKKIEAFLTLWNVDVKLPKINSPETEFESLYQTIEKAYDMEYALYEEYEDTSIKIFKLGDICAFDFLQYFRTIQTESVGEYSDKINMLDGVDTKDKATMLLLEKDLF